jgi:hypothetical protein
MSSHLWLLNDDWLQLNHNLQATTTLAKSIRLDKPRVTTRAGNWTRYARRSPSIMFICIGGVSGSLVHVGWANYCNTI